MAKPYKLTPIEFALSPIEHFQDNISRLTDDGNVAVDNKTNSASRCTSASGKTLTLSLGRVNVSVINKKETSVQDSRTTTQPKEEHSILSSIGAILPHSYREQSTRAWNLTYLMECEHFQVDSK